MFVIGKKNVFHMNLSKSNSLLVSLMALDFLSNEKSVNILCDMRLYKTE